MVVSIGLETWVKWGGAKKAYDPILKYPLDLSLDFVYEYNILDGYYDVFKLFSSC